MLVHDVRNLLLVAAIQIGRVIERLAADSEERNALEAVLRTNEQVSALLRDAIQREAPRRPTPVSDLGALVERIEPLLRACVAPRRFHVRAPRAGVRAAVAAAEAERAIVNLVLNARNATQPHGTIELEVTRVWLPRDAQTDEFPLGWCAAVTVRDDGHGISAQHTARIFEPGFSTRAAAGGNGLGLAAVREVVERCGGRVCLESGPGRGTSFQLCFPDADASGLAPSGRP